MAPKRSIYVAGFDLGVLPMGLWSIATSLSIYSKPLMDSYPSFFSFFLKSFLFTAGWSISLRKVDFPDPETPVIHTNFPRGISTSIFFRLFLEQPSTTMLFPLPRLLSLGTSMVRAPER